MVQMTEILSLLVFQSSRQQLLSILMTKIDVAKAHRDEHKARNEPEDEAEARYIDNMLKAFQAADDHSKRLEYWSDLREMAREGEILGTSEQGWGHEWRDAESNGSKSSALGDGDENKDTQNVRVVEEPNPAPDEDVLEELAEEDKDDEQMEAAKKEAELRQLAEVGELKGKWEEDSVKRPEKLTSFYNDDEEDDVDDEHNRHNHDT
jgi:hypothetical protein